MAKLTLQQRIEEYVFIYGVEGINMCLERHKLTDMKRKMFLIRYVEIEKKKEDEWTRDMEKLTLKINQLDNEILTLGIDSNKRVAIIKDLKKRYKDEWESGFVLSE